MDEELERLKQKLKSEGQDLATVLLQSNKSMDDIRKTLEERARWQEFIRAKATDAELRKYVANHRDLFRGTQIRASHILIALEPNASEADKEKARQKLASIKKEIEGGTISFAAAANKYSEDPANAGGAGGDLDYFSLSSGMIEEFTDVAFKLKKGMISDPVETPFGFHLIQVTDRKEGKEPDFDQNKPYILNQYAADLQKEDRDRRKETGQDRHQADAQGSVPHRPLRRHRRKAQGGHPRAGYGETIGSESPVLVDGNCETTADRPDSEAVRFFLRASMSTFDACGGRSINLAHLCLD